MRIFVTTILPDNLVAKYKMSFAAANFSRNLISGGGFDKVFSLMPLNVNGKLDDFDAYGYDVVYSSLRSKNGMLAKFAIFFEQISIFNQIHKGDSVWLYNLNIINSLLFLLLKVLKRSVKVNVIVLDFTPYKSIKEQNYWNLKLINHSDSAIYLADSPLFKCKKHITLAGVVPNVREDYPTISSPTRDFLLSGVIRESISMTKSVLAAFAMNPECTLHITGKVMEDGELIKNYSSKYKNIIYYGSLPYGQYLDLLHKVTFQLSTRNPEYPENQCNFPSKIIESLLHNRIVVSTIPYPQLHGLRYIKIDPAKFNENLKSISQLSTAELLHYANQADDVRHLFSPDRWNTIMTQLENQ